MNHCGGCARQTKLGKNSGFTCPQEELVSSMLEAFRESLTAPAVPWPLLSHCCHGFWKVPLDWYHLVPFHSTSFCSWRVPGALLAPGELSFFHSRAGGLGPPASTSVCRPAKPQPASQAAGGNSAEVCQQQLLDPLCLKPISFLQLMHKNQKFIRFF